MAKDDIPDAADDVAPDGGSTGRPRRRARSAGPGPEPDPPVAASTSSVRIPAGRPGRAGSGPTGSGPTGAAPGSAPPETPSAGLTSPQITAPSAPSASASSASSADQPTVPGFVMPAAEAAADEPRSAAHDAGDAGTAAPEGSMARSGRWSARSRSARAQHAAGGGSDPGPLLTVVNALFVLLGVGLATAALYGAHRAHGTARTLVLAAAAVAAASVLIAAAGLLARLFSAARSRTVARRPARRLPARVATTTVGVLLLAALVLAGGAAAVAVVAPYRSDSPALALRTTREEGGRSIRVEVTVAGVAADAPIAVSLTGLPATDGGDGLLTSVVQRAGGGATDRVLLDARLRNATSVQVDISHTGRLCQAVIPVQVAVTETDAQITCSAG